MMIIYLFFYQCLSEKLDGDISHKEIPKSKTQIDPLLDTLGKLIVHTANDIYGRAFLKTEALKELDGDYEILFAKVLDQKIITNDSKNPTTYKEYLNEFYIQNTDRKISSNSKKLNFQAMVESILNKYPLLQISIPEISENSTLNWNINQHIPLVAVLDENYYNDSAETIVAYDPFMNKHFLSIDTPPKAPVIVIGQNERLRFKSKKQVNYQYSFKDPESIDPDCYELFFETDTHEYLMPTDCVSEGVGGGDLPISSTPIDELEQIYDRDNNNGNDRLNKARFVSKSAYRRVEAWPSGRPEFKLIITYIEKIGAEFHSRTVIKILPKSGWLYRYVFWVSLRTNQLNIPILNWDKNKYGDSVKYTWIEQDSGGNSVELQLNTTSTFGESNAQTQSTKVTISSRDDEAGESIVYYNDDTIGEGTEYNTGIVRFWINQ